MRQGFYLGFEVKLELGLRVDFVHKVKITRSVKALTSLMIQRCVFARICTCAHICYFLFTAPKEVLKSCDGFDPDGEAAEIKSMPGKILACFLTTVTWICAYMFVSVWGLTRPPH